jgi:Extensin-like protein C-terminus
MFHSVTPLAWRTRLREACGALVASACLGLAGLAYGSNPFLEVPPEPEARDSVAYRYANLDNGEAFAELDRRGIRYRREPTPVPGVRAPIRLTGPLRGVHIHSVLPESERADSAYEILDARLALALHDFCSILSHHDVVEVVHFTMYRPPQQSPGDLDHPQTRHPGGLAIDLGAMRKRSGDWLSVGPHWEGSIGAKTCGAGARKLVPRRARELRSMLCEANDQRLFHYMLSPHFDEAHDDHFHLEIKPGVKWFIAN